MKIDRLSTIGTPAARRSARNGSTKSGDFAKALSFGGEAPPISAVSGGAALAPVDALLALQEVSDDSGGRNQGRRHGEALLEHLDDLHLSLLSGRMPLDALERLATTVAAKRGQVDDPRLAQILDEIEVRAAVELAKLGR
jgi:hypothetical protein